MSSRLIAKESKTVEFRVYTEREIKVSSAFKSFGPGGRWGWDALFCMSSTIAIHQKSVMLQTEIGIERDKRTDQTI